MTADSELFVNEEIRDIVGKKLGYNVAIEVPDYWKDMWAPMEYPDEGKARILDVDTGEPIGTVEWKLDLRMDHDGVGRCIDAYAKDLVIIIQK